MGDSLTARETSVLDMFNARTPLVIPNYQREYSWTEAEAGKLLDDLWAWAFDLESPGRRKANIPPYFLGAILVVEPDDDDAAFVVDGHQRLITLTILFAVLRDLESAKDRRVALHDLVRRRNRSLVRQSAGWRLIPLERDRDAFERWVQTDGATRKAEQDLGDLDAPDAQLRMVANAVHLRSMLKKESARRRREFVTCVLTHTFFARISVTDHDAAFAMFEVINQRGLPLAPKHVIKARVFEELERGSDLERQANATWSSLEARFPMARRDDRSDIDLFERFLDTFARSEETARRARTGTSLIQRFDRAASRHGVDQLVSDILPAAANAYAAFAMHPARIATGDRDIDRLCEFLSWWEDEEWSAAAMRVLTCHPDREKRIAILSRLERFAAVIGLASERKDRRLRDYHRIVLNGDNFDALMDPKGELEPRADLVRLARERLYDPLPLEKSTRRAILARVNALLDPGVHPPIPSRQGSIEHILPRSVTRNTEAAELYPEWTRSEAKMAMETLGNLALMDNADNARADKRPYPEKIAIYFKPDRPSAFALLEDLRLHGISSWTPDSWRERHERLAGLLVKAWELDGTTSQVKASELTTS